MLWIVETHADDAYLSLHGHIVGPWKEQAKTIITVYGNDKRNAETELYAKAVKCQHVALGCKESQSMKVLHQSPSPLVDWGIDFAPSDHFVFPLGLEHEEHKAIGRLAPIGSWRYVDSPCFAKLKLAGELRKGVEGLTVVSIVATGKRKWSHIKMFKSQSKYFYFNPPEGLPKVEIVLQ